MKKILIPTDFSDNAGDALAYALDFLGNTGAFIRIVNIVDNTSPPPAPDVPAMNTEILGIKIDAALKSMEALERFGNDYLKKNGHENIKISTSVTPGGIADSIKNEAEHFKADLIIMGTQGVNHGILDRFFGTVSTRIINNSPCPIILVPSGYKFKVIDDVLFSTNLDHAEPFELNRAINLLKPHEAVLRCLHVVKTENKKYDSTIEEFSKYLIEHSAALQTIFYVETSEDIESVIEEYAETYDVELIIMSKTKKTFLQSLFGTSHTKKMINMTRLPLLVMN